MSAMVTVLTFRSMLLLFVLAVSIMVCFLFSIVLLGLVCLLLNLGSRLKTELMILEKVLGLLAQETKNLCLLGSVTYNCLKLPPVKLQILPLLYTTGGILSQMMLVPG